MNDAERIVLETRCGCRRGLEVRRNSVEILIPILADPADVRAWAADPGRLSVDTSCVKPLARRFVYHGKRADEYRMFEEQGAIELAEPPKDPWTFTMIGPGEWSDAVARFRGWVGGDIDQADAKFMQAHASARELVGLDVGAQQVVHFRGYGEPLVGVVYVAPGWAHAAEAVHIFSVARLLRESEGDDMTQEQEDALRAATTAGDADTVHAAGVLAWRNVWGQLDAARAALGSLLQACLAADGAGELPAEFDGSMMDAALHALPSCRDCDGMGTRDKLPHEDETLAPDNVCQACNGWGFPAPKIAATPELAPSLRSCLLALPAGYHLLRRKFQDADAWDVLIGVDLPADDLGSCDPKFEVLSLGIAESLKLAAQECRR